MTTRPGVRSWSRVAAIVVLLVVTAACGGNGGESDGSSTGGATSAPSTTVSPQERRRAAEDAMKRQFDQVDRGQWGRQWEELHPAQQAFVPKDAFVQCSQKGGLSIESLSILETFEERVAIPGTTVQADSVAITAQVKARIGQLKDDFKQTFHEFEVNGQWRWTISDPEPYKAGRCP